MNQPSLRKSNVKANAAGLACSNGLLGSQECTGASHCRFQPRALSRAQKSNIIQCFLMSACPTGAIAATSFPILPSLQWQEATRWKLLLLGWRPSLQEWRPSLLYRFLLLGWNCPVFVVNPAASYSPKQLVRPSLFRGPTGLHPMPSPPKRSPHRCGAAKPPPKGAFFEW